MKTHYILKVFFIMYLTSLRVEILYNIYNGSDGQYIKYQASKRWLVILSFVYNLKQTYFTEKINDTADMYTIIVVTSIPPTLIVGTTTIVINA